MNKKTIWLALPMAITPLVELLFLAFLFNSAKVSFFAWIMEKVFSNDAILLIPLLFLYIFVAFCLCVVSIIFGFKKKYDALTSAKIIMIIKIIQIPIHVVSFLLGAILFITIFTFVIAILMAIINYLVILMMGLLNIVAMVNSIKQGYTKYRHIIWAIILQFFICVDVVATIIFYILLRKKKKQLEAHKQEKLHISKEAI